MSVCLVVPACLVVGYWGHRQRFRHFPITLRKNCVAESRGTCIEFESVTEILCRVRWIADSEYEQAYAQIFVNYSDGPPQLIYQNYWANKDEAQRVARRISELTGARLDADGPKQNARADRSADEYRLKRRGIMHPYSFSLVVGLGIPISLVSTLVGFLNFHGLYAWLPLMGVLVLCALSQIAAFFYIRQVRIDKTHYYEGASLFG